METKVLTERYEFIIENQGLKDVILRETNQSVAKEGSKYAGDIINDLLTIKMVGDTVIDSLEFRVNELEEEVDKLLTKLNEQDKFIEDNRKRLEDAKD